MVVWILPLIFRTAINHSLWYVFIPCRLPWYWLQVTSILSKDGWWLEVESMTRFLSYLGLISGMCLDPRVDVHPSHVLTAFSFKLHLVIWTEYPKSIYAQNTLQTGVIFLLGTHSSFSASWWFWDLRICISLVSFSLQSITAHHLSFHSKSTFRCVIEYKRRSPLCEACLEMALFLKFFSYHEWICGQCVSFYFELHWAMYMCFSFTFTKW